MIGFAGDRKVFPMGDHLPASSQGKNVNVLLLRGDGISGRLRSTPCGRSRLTIFSRENCQPVIGKR
ncbi:hypothetical protein [Cylindrospermopsis curvispora]|uniref:Uncharacterized protein n=1 Tax=Cylindrospermopsis curvispora GIHE-G1 TaxID=2666332 RepID=A0A7H0F5K8_9CYAN|nr:hypothetical protein [Cylindrospermopsis curvispora]QNP31324.1 hypothetical protein IAR63_13620 [Cylindrospermopsis curvispora GIHE-G1]